MKVLRLLAASLAASSLLAAAAFADSPAEPVRKANPAFERMRALIGDWIMMPKEGKPTTVSYALVSGASTLMERLSPHGEDEMVSMYHADGGKLMMTHYCHAQNQPRMRADALSADGKTLAFEFVDASNLATPDEMHMRRVVITFVDADHFRQEWTWKQGEKTGTFAFDFERVKKA